MATAQVARPRFRGRLHQIAFIVSIPQGIALVAAGANWLSRVAAAVYALTLSAVYGVSAAYHRLDWGPRARQRMRKLDHSMIYLLIAGTYTPISLLVLRGAWAIAMLSFVWAGALFGIGLKVFGMDRMRRVSSSLYIILGWAAVIAAPQMFPKLGVAVVALIAAGGILYTVGAIMFFRKRPDPYPAVFGYHEIWHVMVVAAAFCHYAAVMILVVTR